MKTQQNIDEMLETRKKRQREAKACTPLEYKNFSETDSQRDEADFDDADYACCSCGCPNSRKSCFTCGFCLVFFILALVIGVAFIFVSL